MDRRRTDEAGPLLSSQHEAVCIRTAFFALSLESTAMARSLLLCCLALAFAWPALAASPNRIRAGEVALLPAYCADTMTFGPGGSEGAPTERQRQWVGTMGRGFWTMHHYCWALVSERRAGMAGISTQQRHALLQAAIDDCGFVFANAPGDFVMLPEVHTRVGDYHHRLGRFGEALLHYSRAQALKPDYWPAYVHHARMLMQLNEHQSARAIVDQGLSHAAEEPKLLELRRELSGQRAGASAARGASSAR
jgi:tetratricopeptide (TPR) repeat protein